MLRLALLVQSGATGWERFAVFSVVAFAVFASVLRLALRKRNAAVWPRIMVAGVFIVFGGDAFCAMGVRPRSSVVDLLRRACSRYFSCAPYPVPNVGA